jgi:hypothetical protein
MSNSGLALPKDNVDEEHLRVRTKHRAVICHKSILQNQASAIAHFTSWHNKVERVLSIAF